LRKIMENTKQLLFEGKILSRVLQDDELTSLYLEKNICLLNLDTKDIDVHNDIELNNAIRLLGPKMTLTLDPEIDNKRFLERIPSTTTIKALHLRDPRYHNVKIGCTDSIHIWNYDLEVLFRYLENNPNITEITSCYDAVSFAEYSKFMDQIKNLNRMIDIKIQYIETKEQEQERERKRW
jgi:hypothetical protein